MAESRPRKLKRVIIREEYVALTGDYKKAVLLHQLEWCQSQAYDIDRYLGEEGKRLAQEGVESNIQPANGWFSKKASDLSEETLLGLSDSNIALHLGFFVERGWLQERANPRHKWDRRKQYRLDLVRIKTDLEKIGYQLEGWDLGALTPSNSTFSKIENGISKTENAFSKTKNGVSILEDRISKTEERYINTSLKHHHENTHSMHWAQTSVPLAADFSFNNTTTIYCGRCLNLNLPSRSH